MKDESEKAGSDGVSFILPPSSFILSQGLGGRVYHKRIEPPIRATWATESDLRPRVAVTVVSSGSIPRFNLDVPAALDVMKRHLPNVEIH
jgi:hypothetical protein